MQQETNSKIAKQASSIVPKLATTMTATEAVGAKASNINGTYRRKEAGIQLFAGLKRGEQRVWWA